MKYYFLTAFFIGHFAFAISTDSIDNSGTDSKPKIMTAEMMRYMTNIQGEVMAFNSEGTRYLYSYDEQRSWSFSDTRNSMNNFWIFEAKGEPSFYLSHEWTLSDTGVLSVNIKQYASAQRKDGSSEVTPGDLIKEANFEVKDLMPIQWEYHKDKNKKLVIRFTPVIWPEEEALDIGGAVNGRNMVVYDGKGNVWAKKIKNTEAVNKYFGVQTSYGSVFVSFFPFKGAKEIGTAKRGLIDIKAGNHPRIFIQSDSSFVTDGVKAKIYGFVDMSRKAQDKNRVRTFGSSSEESFLKNIR